jgi:2-keto-3-deoxy-L-arabinonate dehydratase
VGEAATFDFLCRVSDAIDILIMIQDAPVSGTPLPAPFLARMAQEIAHVDGRFLDHPPMMAC